MSPHPPSCPHLCLSLPRWSPRPFPEYVSGHSTFSSAAAAKDAGLSRRLGGIHFQDGDEHGYNLGQRVASNVLARTMGYVNGTIAP